MYIIVDTGVYIHTYNELMNKLEFEWDNNKDKINISKHGISFDEA